jgi:alpha-L-fucosidase 2
MAEMLLQSHLDKVHLLPALPSSWPEGNVTGLKARGGFEVNISWKKSALTGAQLKSLTGGELVLLTSVPVRIQGSKQTATKTDEGYVLRMKTEKGKVYAVLVK